MPKKPEPEEKAIVKGLLPTNRFGAMVDGIFSVAMTLLVLSIAVPLIAAPSNQTILQELVGLIPQFFVYAFAFVLLSAFWLHHHEYYSLLHNIDALFFWSSIFWLMLIVFVPFSAALTSKYGQLEVAAMFFHANMLAIGFLFFLGICYSIRKKFVHPWALKKAEKLRIEAFSFPITAMLAILFAAFISPQFSYAMYFLNPVVDRISKKLLGFR
jgi:uncharacterized membrane protein